MARGSCQVCARNTQSSSDAAMGGRSPVRRRSATTTSSRASNGATPRARAISPTVRPSTSAFSGANVSSKTRRSHTARWRKIPASSDCAPASSRRRVAGSDNAAMRSSTGRANTSRQPGSPSRMAPCSKLRRSCMVWGSVRATTVAPRSDAAVPAASWLTTPSGFMAETPSTFQLTGRSASSDIVARKSTSSSVKPLRQPGTISSTVVPSWARTAVARRSISAAGRGARRHGLAVAVVVRVHLRGREAQCALRQGGVQRLLHGVDVPGARRRPRRRARP